MADFPRQWVAFPTAMGWVAVLASARGLVAATLPCATEGEALRQIGGSGEAGRAPGGLQELATRFQAYFRGERVSFDDALDLGRYSPFQRHVWEAARGIPFGEVRTYRWVAGQIKRPLACRAVGGALGRNPLPVIIPCHRVIASDGGLGGYSGGLDMKRRLLSLESTRGHQDTQ